MNLLDKLNEPQKEAVLATDGPLLILAGAGSGKTRVITHRVAYLIGEKHVPPTCIMAVTFTNKAADEMKQRLIKMVGPLGKSIFVKTFHSAAVFILRRYGSEIGISENFSIYDTRDQEDLIKEILLELHIDIKKVKPFGIISKISEIKDKAQALEGGDLTALMPKMFGVNFPHIYDEYHARLRSRNALDFNDLLVETVNLLRKSPSTRERLQSMWKYFMIDEYQDTNTAQYLICKYLAEKTRNICVVGDDDQSIYSWRGADITNILNFEKDYPETKVIRLEHNYRSTKEILDAAGNVIKNNTQRMGKEIISARGEGEKPVWCTVNNEYGEADYIVRTVSRLKREEKIKNKDIALFYRTNAQSRVFEDYLRRENIPYRIIGGLKFYDRKEIKDLVAYLKFAVNPKDTGSLLRIINTPTRGIGTKTVELLRTTAKESAKSEWEVIDANMPVGGKVVKGIQEFGNLLRGIRSRLAEVPHNEKLSNVIMDFVNGIGYRQAMLAENTPESKSRLENIDEFLNSVFEFEMRNNEGSLSEFLQEIALLTSEDEDKEEGDNKMTLMTVHCSKGLEYPVVFLTGMEENLFPHANTMDSDSAVEEERRLCYVGITRAMDRLYMTSAELRRSYAGVDYRSPSRFLFEIDQSLLVRVYHEDTSGVSSDRLSAAQRNWENKISQDKGTTAPASETINEELFKSDSAFKIKDRVLHPKYGVGRVITVEGSGDNVKLSVAFDSAGLKTFMEKYTPLEKV
jgi:DNA helicase II / ATP-dependent DNA helicase PcrA